MSKDLLPAVRPDKPYQPEKWTGVHRRIVSLSESGYRNYEIAELVGLTPSRISIILNDPRADIERRTFAKKVVEQVQDIQLKIALHAEEALEEIVDEMRNAESAKIRQTAAFGILDRAGYSPVKKTQEIEKAPSLPAGMLDQMHDVLNSIEATEVSYRVVSSEPLEEDDDE